VEVVYYTTDNQVIARGEKRVTYDFGMKNYEVTSQLRGEKGSVSGEVSALSGIKKIVLQVLDKKSTVISQKSIEGNGVRSFEISEVNMEFEKLSEGEKVLRVIVEDKYGKKYVKDMTFSIREATTPKIIGLLNEYRITMGENLQLAGDLSSEALVETLSIRIQGTELGAFSMDLNRSNYSLSAITLKTFQLPAGNYQVEIYVKTTEDQNFKVKQFKLVIEYPQVDLQDKVISEKTEGNDSQMDISKLDKRIQEALKDSAKVGLDEESMRDMIFGFRYMQHASKRAQEGWYGTTLTALNEATYYIYNGSTDMLFGEGTKKSIIKSTLKLTYLHDETSLINAVNEEVKKLDQEIGNINQELELVSMFVNLDNSTAKTLLYKLQLYCRWTEWDSSTHKTKVYDDELIKLLGPYLTDADSITLDKKTGGYFISDDISSLISDIADGKVDDASYLTKAKYFTSEELSKILSAGKKVMVYVDTATVLMEQWNVYLAYSRVTESQINELIELRSVVTDEITLEVLDELIEELEYSFLYAVRDMSMIAAQKVTSTLAGEVLKWIGNGVAAHYLQLYEGSKLVANMLVAGGAQAKASHNIGNIIDTNMDATNQMIRNYYAFRDNPSEETLQTLCNSIQYYVATTKEGIKMGTLYETDRFIIWGDAKRQKEYEEEEMERLQPFIDFYNKYNR